MGAISIKARAKVNLCLKVGPRTSARYHQITSIMQSVSLADVMTMETAEDLSFDCDDTSLRNKDNLVVKAANALARRSNTQAGAKIALKKNIPIGAGLGGGSADAAAALIGLNRLWNLGLPLESLAEVAVDIGADVSFCLSGGTALVTGFGDKVETLPPVDIGPFLIAKPNGSLASSDVYRRYDELGGLEASGIDGPVELVAGDRRIDGLSMARDFGNDLEEAAIDLMPEISTVKNKALDAGAFFCLVSGSGPAVLIFAKNSKELAETEKDLGESFEVWRIHCVGHGSELEVAGTDSKGPAA